MRKHSHRTVSAALACTVLVTACAGGGGDDGQGAFPSEPQVIRAGTTSFVLATPPAGLAAIRMRIVGSGMSQLSARGGAQILLQQTTSDTISIVLAIPSAGGIVLDVKIANVAVVPTVTVQEATGGRILGYRMLSPNAVVFSSTSQ